jgi:hypothetical protein
VVSRDHHLLPVVLPVLVPPVVALLGQGRAIVAVAFAEVTSNLGFATEDGLDHLLTSGILGGDVQELLHRAWGLVAEHVDKRLAGHATVEGIDDVSVGDVGELFMLLGETLDVLPGVSSSLCL